MNDVRTARITGASGLPCVALSVGQFPLWLGDYPSFYDGPGFARHLFAITKGVTREDDSRSSRLAGRPERCNPLGVRSGLAPALGELISNSTAWESRVPDESLRRRQLISTTVCSAQSLLTARMLSSRTASGYAHRISIWRLAAISSHRCSS